MDLILALIALIAVAVAAFLFGRRGGGSSSGAFYNINYAFSGSF